MIDEPGGNSDRKRRLDELIAAYLRAEAAGEAPDRERLFAENAELAEELAAFFAEQDRKTEVDVSPTRVVDLTLPLSPTATDAGGLMPPSRADAPTRRDPTVRELSPGVRVRYFGDYELIDVIARGGMGVVYKAVQVKLQRIVALKMILHGQFAGEEDVERFYAEARAAGNLNHPGIVPVYEVGEVDGQHYFSMGFVDGNSLAVRVAEGPLPPREAAGLVRQVAEAVQYAHQQGVIHRDIKPANVLVDSKGKPLVTDFGLAKRTGLDSGLTATGQVLGTPSYMPPEQAMGRLDLIGPTSDVYSLGAVLYCLLGGRPPFQSAFPLDTLTQVREQEPVRLRQFSSTVPQDLETITLKCLEKEPAKRYATAQELAEELDRYLEGKPVLARPLGPLTRLWRWCRRKPALATAAGLALASTLAAMLILSVAVVLISSSRDNERIARRQAETELTRSEWLLYASRVAVALRDWEVDDVPSAWRRLESCPKDLRGWEFDYACTLLNKSHNTIKCFDGPAAGVAYSPDGKLVAVAGRKGAGNVPELHVWETDSGVERFNLKGHAMEVKGVAFSRDGQWIVSAGADAAVRLWNAKTGQPVRTLVGHTREALSAAISPDGQRIAAGAADGTVRVWDAASGRETLLYTGHAGSVGVLSLAFSPDGKRIASAGYDSSVRLWDAATGQEAFVAKSHAGPIDGLAFSADGTRIATASGDKTVRVWDAATGLETMTLQGHADEVRGVAFRPDGKQIASVGGANTVKLWDAATGRETASLRGHCGHSVYAVAYRPDGTQLATVDDGGRLKLWNLSTDQRPLAFRAHRREVNNVAFSPDGRRIVSADREGVVRVWDARTAKEALALTGLDYAARAAFTPDGRHIVASRADGTITVWDANGDGKSPLRVINTPPSPTSLAISPDGKRVAINNLQPSLAIWDLETGRQVAMLAGHTRAIDCVVFSPLGTRIATGGGDAKIKIWDSASGRELLSLSHKDHMCVRFSPNGKRLAAGGPTGIAVWDAETGEPLAQSDGHITGVVDLAYTPDGKRIFTVVTNGPLKFWDAETFYETLSLRTHNEAITGAAISPDGARIATCSGSEPLKVWDASLGPNTSH